MPSYEGGRRRSRRKAEDETFLQPDGEFTGTNRHRGFFSGHAFRTGDKVTGYYEDKALQLHAHGGQEPPTNDPMSFAELQESSQSLEADGSKGKARSLKMWESILQFSGTRTTALRLFLCRGEQKHI